MQARYRINPIEVIIFAGVVGVFLFSAYRLFSGPTGFEQSNREIAADTSFLSLAGDNCEQVGFSETLARKIQITGPFCGLNSGGSLNKMRPQILKTEITNRANRSVATVFTELDRGKFSTDFIALKDGENPIRLKFVYSGGHTFEKEFVITRMLPKN